MGTVKEWLVALGTLCIALLILLAMAYGLTQAHEAMSGWQYPADCCSDRDCHEYPAENVEIRGDGFLLKSGLYIPRTKARVSPDGHYHICEYPSSGAMISTYDQASGQSLPCFWYPPQGM